jgi:carbonic anhydrase/acetyltransferase-like protein (isoleucine patch superfamily)
MLRTLNSVGPSIAEDAFVADSANVVGRVSVGEGSSVWYGAVLRGDVNDIVVGARTSVQDGAVLHCDADAPCLVGNDVTIGHLACVHGCTVGDGAVIGIGAIVLSKAVVGPGAVVAAGALVPEGAVVPADSLVVGVPAKTVRPVTVEERQRFQANCGHYVELGKQHARCAGADAGRRK